MATLVHNPDAALAGANRNSIMAEHHFSPEELGGMWGLSADTVRRLFEHEPGVLVLERSRSHGRRRYRTVRIPESVAQRVHRRMSNPG